MKTCTIIKEINAYYDIYAELKHDQIRIYNRKLLSVPFICGFHKDATFTDESLDRITPSMQGLCLDTLTDIRNLIDKYLATPIEDREDTSLYYVKLPSGHYMRNFYESPCAVPTIEWTTSIGLARAYTKHELKELNELYWTLAIPAFPDFLKNNEEEK